MYQEKTASQNNYYHLTLDVILELLYHTYLNKYEPAEKYYYKINEDDELMLNSLFPDKKFTK
jgi:hypothetical protein